MAQKHLLQDLLKQDQEPFYLNTYISDKRIQLNKQHQFPDLKSHFQFHHLKNQIPISRKPKFPIQFCKNSCFNFPEVQNPPLYEFRSPAKNPCNSSNSVLFCIPDRTPTLLLEASSRISTKKKKQSKNLSKLRLFGSVLNKLKKKNRNQKLKIGDDEVIKVKELIDFELAVSSCFCRSPSFRFVLETSSVSDIHTPDFSSPERSNHCDGNESKLEIEELDNNVQVHEEEKEQFSPVSVLDPLSEDDDETHLEEEHNNDRDDNDHDDNDTDESSNRSYDLECSHAFVQRAKQQLLQKLRRFELLAELDPIDLEKRLLHYDQEESETEECKHEVYKSNDEWIIKEVLNKQCFKNTPCMISTDMKKLVSHLVLEEKREHNGIEIVKRVSKRLDSLKQVESNTIDMMVEFDFGKEVDGWKRNDQEQFSAIEIEFEFDILQQLVDELLDELIC